MINAAAEPCWLSYMEHFTVLTLTISDDSMQPSPTFMWDYIRGKTWRPTVSSHLTWCPKLQRQMLCVQPLRSKNYKYIVKICKHERKYTQEENTYFLFSSKSFSSIFCWIHKTEQKSDTISEVLFFLIPQLLLVYFFHCTKKENEIQLFKNQCKMLKYN